MVSLSPISSVKFTGVEAKQNNKKQISNNNIYAVNQEDYKKQQKKIFTKGFLVGAVSTIVLGCAEYGINAMIDKEFDKEASGVKSKFLSGFRRLFKRTKK